MDTEVVLDKAQSSHISRVLRLQQGQVITLFNGDGNDYEATIVAVGKATTVKIGSVTRNQATPASKIHLAQAMARGDRMDYAIQKAVEMGVSEITPLTTEYVQLRLDYKRLSKKLRHWQGVIIAALEQSGRADWVKLNSPMAFTEWCQAANKNCLYLHPRTSYQMADVLPGLQENLTQEIQLAIGPEGGFSDAEMALVPESNIISLGTRILRTETAATAVLAILQHSL